MSENQTPEKQDEKKPPLLAGLHEYLDTTRSPIYSLWLAAPFATVYLLGVFLLHHVPGVTYTLNYGDSFIKACVSKLWDNEGLHRWFPSALSAAVLVASFAVWQLYKRTPIKVEPGYAGLMLTESLFFAVLLRVLDLLIESRPLVRVTALTTYDVPQESLLEKIVVACGAGVFEELVFRVFLVGLATLFLWKAVGLGKTTAFTIAVVLGAVVFTLVHYQPFNPSAVAMEPGHIRFWQGFFFRLIAGIMLGVLCFLRSFGVAVGAHALYDILLIIQQEFRE